jgi:hypothetical protein
MLISDQQIAANRAISLDRCPKPGPSEPPPPAPGLPGTTVPAKLLNSAKVKIAVRSQFLKDNKGKTQSDEALEPPIEPNIWPNSALNWLRQGHQATQLASSVLPRNRSFEGSHSASNEYRRRASTVMMAAILISRRAATVSGLAGKVSLHNGPNR